MKFCIKTARGELAPIEKCYPALNDFKFEQRSKKGSYWTYYWGVVEIDSVEELVKLKNAIGKPLIIGGLEENRENTITIYDDWLE